MDTNVNDINPNALIDMFPEIGQSSGLGGKVNFSMETKEVDMFGNAVPSATGETTQSASGETTQTPSASGETTLAPSATGETTETPIDNPDILGEGKGAAATKSDTKTVTGLSDYYQERINNGKFVKVYDTDDKGNKVLFIPKTPEEYDEVFDIQVKSQLEEAKKDLEKRWYEGKSPAWRAISQYAEMVDDPTQLIPFLSGVKTLQSVATLNENEVDGAEAIVRTRMEQAGDPQEIIDSQIEALKTTDKLLSTAKTMKPLIIQQEQASLQRMQQQELLNQQNWLKTIAEVRTNAIAAIEKPLFGKEKLKQDEKAAIYDLIAEPSEENQGYGIYNVIDSLFDKKDFETLAQVALLLSKKDAFYGYLGTSVANQTAASLEKKLRLSTEGRSASGHDFDEGDAGKPVVTRNQFNKKPSFGRG